MGTEIVFFIKAIIFGLAAAIIIPKKLYKKYFIYGLIFGGLVDFVLVLMIGVIAGGVQYKNMGVFSVFDITSFWTPISWMLVQMIFLYLLPRKKLYFYPYVLSYGIFGYCVGLVLENFGLFKYRGVFRYLYPLVIIGWFYSVARLYMYEEKITLERRN